MNSKKNQPGQAGSVKRSSDIQGKEGEQEEDLYVVNFYHTGDINVQIPVYLAPTASVVGNVTSPKVIVAGRLFGVIAADSVLIAQGGHIWGDIYTTEFQLEPEGKSFGWIITLDKGTIELLRAGDINRGDLPTAGDRHVHPDFRKEHGIGDEQQPIHPDHQKFIYHHFQAELAAAQMARIEIELTFEDRLTEALRQSEVHLLFDTNLSGAAESTKGGTGDDADIADSQTSTGTMSYEEQLQLENELKSFKQKTSNLLEQLARLKAVQAATENELDELKREMEIKTKENGHLRESLAEMQLYDVLPQEDKLAEDNNSFGKLKADMAEAHLKIIELEADLAYCLHLSRKARNLGFDV
jgi:cytoskeletal protein CcmA (bactofilin family)